jgi:hypothetical protein
MKNKWCCDMIQVPKSFALDLRPNMLHNSSHDGLLKTMGQGEKKKKKIFRLYPLTR